MTILDMQDTQPVRNAIAGRWATINEIAREIGMSRYSVSRQLAKLEQYDIAQVRPRREVRGKVLEFEFTAWTPKEKR